MSRNAAKKAGRIQRKAVRYYVSYLLTSELITCIQRAEEAISTELSTGSQQGADVWRCIRQDCLDELESRQMSMFPGDLPES